MNADRPLDARAFEWLRTNIALGSGFGESYAQLRAHGFSDKAIAQALDQLAPRGDALAGGRLEAPPLVRRAPPNLRRIENPKIELYALDDFMSAEDCLRLIEFAAGHLIASPVTSDGGDPYFRTSKTCLLAHLRTPLGLEIDARICRTLGIRPAYGEGIQVQRYDVGEEFKTHTDYFEPGTRTHRSFATLRGNRTWTFMVYLNEGMEGGGTRFADIDTVVQPKLGMALLWNNLHPDGSPNTATHHSGEPVTSGHKVIITKWFRTRGDGPVFYE